MTRKEWRSLTSFGVILLIFCTSLVIGVGAAAAAPSASIDPVATIGLNPTDTFSVTVNVDSDTNDLRAAKVNLLYDSSALQVNSITEDGLLGGSILAAPGNGDDGVGTISFGIASTAGTYSPQSGAFITIMFEVKAAAAAGTYNLDLTNVELLDDANAAIMGVVVTDGTATVGAAPTSNPTIEVNPMATLGLNPGNIFQVMVDVDSNSDDLRAVNMNLFYDSSALQVNSITEGGLLGGSTLTAPGSGDNGAGMISYGMASTAGTYSPQAGTFISIMFQIKDTAVAGTYNLDLANVMFLDDINAPIMGVAVIDGTVDVTVEVIPDGIILMPGWNFISVPYELNNSSVDNILADINYSALSYYNTNNSSWESVATFDPLKGYWINVPMDEDVQVVLKEDLVPKVPTSPATIQLYAGWNSIGYTDSMDILSAELTLGSIDDCYTSIWGPWMPDMMSYEYVGHNGQTGVIENRHVGTDVFDMSPYNGYWVFLTQDCMLNSIGS